MSPDEAIELLTGGRDGVAKWNEYITQGGVPPKLCDVNLSGCDLRGVSLLGVELSGADLHGTRLTRSTIARTKLIRANLTDADLSQSNVSDSDLMDSNLGGGTLDQVTLSDCCLKNANLSKARLTKLLSIRCDFSHAVLSRVEAVAARFENTKFNEAAFALADLSRAVATDSFFNGARCLSANFSGGEFVTCDFTAAELADVDFTGASLYGSTLRNADLRGADLSDADLRHIGIRRFAYYILLWVLNRPRFQSHYCSLKECFLEHLTIPFILDDTRIKGTRFHPFTGDPWSLLRRNYTGPSFVFHLLFLILFFSPLILKTVGLAAVSKLRNESIALSTWRVSTVANKLRSSVDENVKNWAIEAQAIIDDDTNSAKQSAEFQEAFGRILLKATELHDSDDVDAARWAAEARSIVGATGLYGESIVRELSVWQLLLGLDKNWLGFLFVFCMLAYNVGRGWLTYSVGPLREQEERTNDSPAWEDYRRAFYLHRFLVSPLFILAVLSFTLNCFEWLNYPIWVSTLS